MEQKNLSITRNLKIGTFHIGSTMADVLGAGVWNRVMIQDLQYAATPVGLLLALRYFMAPLATWAGQRSDYTALYGYRRLPWVWGGRLMMVVGYLLVAFSTVELVRHGSLWWSGIILGFIISSIGYSISGSTFLALVYDRAAEHQRGRAIGIVWTFLLAGYAIAGILFARLLPEYKEGEFVTFFVTVGALMIFIWVVSLWGEEKPVAQEVLDTEKPTHERPSFLEEIRGLLESHSARMLAWFMVLSFVGAFMQDALLEPFGGKVFGLETGDTSRFQAYWGTSAILFSGITLWAYRRFPGIGYRRFTRFGVVLMILTFTLLNITAFAEMKSLLYPSLLLLGVGYGFWNIGTLGLMVENTRESKAGLDLGVWTLMVTLFRGGGILVGTILFDLFNTLFSDSAASYGIIFAIEAILLILSLAALHRIEDRATAIPEIIKSDMILSAVAD
ncbi:MAG: BCD family MFS transporter [Anaerolineae bacterium]|nr:BCD family MFS transporter [Anaerolineae bacterium]